MSEGLDKVSSVERQLYILSLLSKNNKGYTMAEIIDAMGRVGIDATKRMVSRDIDYITQNFFVYEQVLDKKTYYKADKYGLYDIDFSVSQIISLYFAKEVLAPYEHMDMGKNVGDIIDNILSKLPSLSKVALNNIKQMLKVAPLHLQEDNINIDILDTIKEAAENKHTVILEYISFSNEKKETREFAPYVIEVNDGCYHTIGKCYLRDAIRDFRVSRIISAQKTQKSFEIPAKFYEDYKKTRFSKLAGEENHDIKIEFTGMAKKLVEEFYKYKADKIEVKEDKLIFYKHASLSKDLISFILTFGAQAKVISPQMLKESVMTEIDNMANVYKD